MANPVEREPAAPTPPTGGPVRLLPRVPTPFEVAVKVAFAVAQEGAMRWFAMLSSAICFGYTLWEPSLMRWGIATTYCALIFVAPVFRRKEE